MVGLAALVMLGAGGYFAWKRFMAPAPVAATPKTAATKTAAKAANGPTPSETLNKLAHAPAEAINKAQDALAARRANGQARVDAAVNGEEPPERPAAPKQPAPKAAQTVTTSVAPGVTATTALEAASEASPAFRSFVANARVSGVFQGSPPRAVINGKLTRVGEAVDSGLGITFEGIDATGHNLVFKDRSGATVLRRF